MSLRGSADGSLAVPVEWTDRAPPSPYEKLGIEPSVLDVSCLLELVELMDRLGKDLLKGA